MIMIYTKQSTPLAVDNSEMVVISELYIYGRLTSVNLGIFGRHFQSPNVRGQIFFQIFVAGSLSEGVFSILKEQDSNKTSFIS